MVVEVKPFVSADFVAAHPDAVLLDARYYLDGRSGRDAFEAGHIPDARFIDMDSALAGHGQPTDGRHPLPAPEVFERAMREAGVNADSLVVAYDDAGGVMAARAVWMLRAQGVNAAVLDGGIQAFSGQLEVGPSAAGAGTFHVAPWPAHLLADMEETMRFPGVVIDARQRDRYEGAPDNLDPRFGHIPGAHSLPCREHLEDGRLKSDDSIRSAAKAVGIWPDTPYISYCGSGVTACHNLLVLEQAGVGNGRLFPGSWSAYAATDLPLEVGPDRV